MAIQPKKHRKADKAEAKANAPQFDGGAVPGPAPVRKAAGSIESGTGFRMGGKKKPGFQRGGGPRKMGR